MDELFKSPTLAINVRVPGATRLLTVLRVEIQSVSEAAKKL